MKNSCQQSVFRFQNRHPQKFEHAFSLYDALVALTVVSMLATAAVPSFRHLITSQRMSGAINSLVTGLHLARSEAIKRRAQAVLCPSVDGRACHNGGSGGTVWEKGYLLYIDHNGNREFDVNDTMVWLFDATADLHIRSSAGRDHVTYQPNGMASGSNLTITFCDKHGRGTPRAVIVSNSGRPRVSARNASGSAILCPSAS
jgi:type IV fimbrial biogenesis protein FimT